MPTLAGVVVLLLVLVLALPVVPDQDGWPDDFRGWFKFIFGGLAALLLVAKEVLSAFARDPSQEGRKNRMEDWAAICGLFGVVFGAPAVYAQLIGS